MRAAPKRPSSAPLKRESTVLVKRNVAESRLSAREFRPTTSLAQLPVKPSTVPQEANWYTVASSVETRSERSRATLTSARTDAAFLISCSGAPETTTSPASAAAAPSRNAASVPILSARNPPTSIAATCEPYCAADRRPMAPRVSSGRNRCE